MKKLFLSFSLLLLSSFSLFLEKGNAACNSYGYTACTPFKDISNHSYKTSIDYVQQEGIVSGYADGTYKPDNTINRAEFTKILVEAIFGTPAESTGRCFSDIAAGMWFEKYVCEAKEKKVLGGYPDGTFQAANEINFAEAAKILVNAFNLSHREVGSGEEWYVPFLITLEEKGAIPTSISKSNHALTRGEMAEMIMRIRENISTRASLKACDLVPSLCPNTSFSGFGDEALPNIDMQRVRQTWLEWYNGERRTQGLHDYKYNNALNRSAYVWSDFSMQRGELSHKRPGQTAYYDYNMINDWFRNLGLQFENVQRVTHSENIGWGPYSCNDSDCTDELLSTIRSTFDFYMSEKDKAYKPHYNSVMNQYFNEIGLGITVGGGKYYLTVHYGTKVL
ncbi:MAG: S-layer homology domain-containing protein [Candidatus Altimarinota bacterium]